MSNLPFKIVGIEHVALAVENVEMPTKFFGELLGIKHTSTENVVDQKVGTHIFDTNQGKVELLSALSENSPISNFLKKRGEGIHHIAFKVDKLQEALDFLKQNGIELIDETPKIGAEGLNIAFIHPKSTNGVLIELCADP